MTKEPNGVQYALRARRRNRLEVLAGNELGDNYERQRSAEGTLSMFTNCLRRLHSNFWSWRAAARSLAPQVAVMQALAAFWKFVLVQTQSRSALWKQLLETKQGSEKYTATY